MVRPQNGTAVLKGLTHPIEEVDREKQEAVGVCVRAADLLGPWKTTTVSFFWQGTGPRQGGTVEEQGLKYVEGRRRGSINGEYKAAGGGGEGTDTSDNTVP